MLSIRFPWIRLALKQPLNYPSADLRESSFIVDNFSMSLDGEKINRFTDLQRFLKTTSGILKWMEELTLKR